MSGFDVDAWLGRIKQATADVSEEVLQGDFILRDGSHSDTYVVRRTVTDTELAAMDARHAAIPHMTDGVPAPICRCNHSWPCPTVRLIAALRASRAEVEQLSGWAGHWSTRAVYAEAEVKRLQGVVESLRSALPRDARNAYDNTGNPHWPYDRR